MKFRKLKWPIMASILLIGLGTSCSEDPVPELEVVNIPDARLLVQIKAALELDATDEVTVADMLLLETLEIDGEGDLTGEISEISNLTGLEFAENLTYLHFGATNVTDLTPIRDLKKIEYLRMNDTGVTDLSPISNYTTLTYFNANTTTGITNISPLGNNVGMKEIILREVPFGNAGMPTIKKFTGLYRINMRSTGVTDITVLGELMAAGALLNSTAGAAAAGGATLDLRGLTVGDWSPIRPYLSQISNIEGVPAE